jgi:hypothetical protein
MSFAVRSPLSLASLALALVGAGVFGFTGSGCNFIVGVGDYAAGTAGDGSSDGGNFEGSAGTGSSSGTGPATDDGGGNAEAGPPADGGGDGPASGDGAVDAPGDVAVGPPGDGGGGPCARDTNVACASGYGVGYTCQGTHYPEETHSRWSCSSTTTTSTTSSYCCLTCSSDSAVTGCPLHTTGESCDDTDTPKQDFSDNCTVASSAGIGAYGFCCSPLPIASASCSTNADCNTYSSYAVCDGTKHCVLATGAIGDPCTTASDCGSSLICNGEWCRSSSCTSDTSCGTASSGLPNQCQPAGSSGNVCFPSCAAYNDCYVYTNAFCVSGGASSSYGVCSNSNGGIGDPCNSDSDCTGSLVCSFDFWACTQPCSGTGATTCGTNSAGKTNVCLYDNYDTQYECVPGCSTNKDCLAYYDTHTCTSVSGGSACQP